MQLKAIGNLQDAFSQQSLKEAFVKITLKWQEDKTSKISESKSGVGSQHSQYTVYIKINF